MNYAIFILIIFGLTLIFLLKSLKRNGRFIKLFSYVLGLLLVVSVIYVELVAKPIPYIGKVGENNIAVQNEKLLESIKEGTVTKKQKKIALLQSFEEPINKELYLNDANNINTQFIVRKSVTAKVVKVQVYKLATYFEGYEYKVENYPTYKIEGGQSLLPNLDDVIAEPVYIISSSAFFLPYSTYYEGERKTKDYAWRNNGTQIVEVTVPENIKVYMDEVDVLDD